MGSPVLCEMCCSRQACILMESNFAGVSSLPALVLPANITMGTTLPLQSCLAVGMPGLPQHRHLKGVLEMSSEGKCIQLPLITLQ